MRYALNENSLSFVVAYDWGRRRPWCSTGNVPNEAHVHERYELDLEPVYLWMGQPPPLGLAHLSEISANNAAPC